MSLKKIARVISLKSTVSPSHSLSISQTRDLHEWFYSLPAIILPSLQQCFLKYACPTFPHHLPNSNGCPLLSPLFSSASSPILPLLSATLLYLWLTQFPGLIHPAVLRQAVERQTDWQTDTKGTPTSRHGCLCCAHYSAHPPLYENNPSLSASLCQTRLGFFVFMAPDARTRTRTRTIYSLVCRENRRLIHCLTDSLQQGGLLSIHNHNNFTCCALCKLWPGADLRNSSCQKSGGSSLENDSGRRGWRCGLASICLSASWHNDLIHLQKVCLEIRNDCSILWDWIL